MRTVTLTRNTTGDEGTFGQLVTDENSYFWTGELPSRNNLPGKSCIPIGIYTCTYRESPKHGWCYHVENVEGRTDIEIHAANFMGDVEKGFQCQLLGCISLGFSIGPLEGQRAILESKKAIAAFEAKMNKETFDLIIHSSSWQLENAA